MSEYIKVPKDFADQVRREKRHRNEEKQKTESHTYEERKTEFGILSRSWWSSEVPLDEDAVTVKNRLNEEVEKVSSIVNYDEARNTVRLGNFLFISVFFVLIPLIILIFLGFRISIWWNKLSDFEQNSIMIVVPIVALIILYMFLTRKKK